MSNCFSPERDTDSSIPFPPHLGHLQKCFRIFKL
jgi:hypothetical protein